jgi:hypothetical protein
MKKLISDILSFLFPFEEPISRKSVFIQEAWIDNVMRDTQVKDYLWTPSFVDLSTNSK